MQTGEGETSATSGAQLERPGWRAPLELSVFVLVSLLIYTPALHGEFLSDDLHYIWNNPNVVRLSWAGLIDLFDPAGTAAMATNNYEPLHLLLLGLEVALFGRDPFGFHVVNVLVHSCAAWLLLCLFRRTAIAAPLCFFGASLFLVHPASVEAVAWITQLKTTASFVLALAALLLLPRRPGLATLVFVLALLTKAQAVVVLPVAAALAFAPPPAARSAGEPSWSGRGSWIVGWLGVALAYGAVELATFSAASDSIAPLHEDRWLNLANIAVVAGRYLWMATTSMGLSAFHQPDAVTSPTDARFLAATLVLFALAARAAWTLRRRSTEFAYWVFALGSFAPVSQVFPFLHPVGDRYLYYMLPGLIGAGLCALRSLTLPAGSQRAVVALGLAVVLGVGFAWRAHDRARIWSRAGLVFADSAAHYPDGLKAHVLRGLSAGARGDVAAAVESFDAARQRGFSGLGQLMKDPALRRLRGDPRWEALLESLARERAQHFAAQRPTQIGFANLAYARTVLGDRAGAIEALTRGLTLEGPMREKLERDLAALRAAGPRLTP